ncbi:hypothetical protein NE586_12255 [Gemmiger formicilis]|uniref:hypothetical protein n=1 Tax=Gemmiger formicilis TaxID=745368 RepID=UPI00210C58F4|nr:hypothetical protein [Gemmiger formicilis]MCQ5080657.1 hypothetical protein [Gemmiger formicilis]MCQ5116565.1 hypothetical protein [Gemmiger formicilis]
MYCRVVIPGPALHRKPAPGGQLIADTDRQQPLVNPISFVAFSVLGGLRLQLLTICQQLVCAFCFKSLLQLGPVIAGTALVWLFRQNRNHIHKWKNTILPFPRPTRCGFSDFQKAAAVSFPALCSYLFLRQHRTIPA